MTMTLTEFMAEWEADSPTLLVHTSGSTGEPKPLWVEKRRMEASARITCRFLGLREGDTALLCLPLDYIAGKMMVVRSLVCGLRLLAVPPSGHPLAQDAAGATALPPDVPLGLVAMVPLQVWNSLQVPAERERLMQIRHLIIGGGAVDDALASQLQDFPHAVWSTYGMTETLSHIALRRLNGPQRSDWYAPFPGVGVSLSADGCLAVSAPAVHDGPLVTNDVAELESPSPAGEGQGVRFRILGRKDNVICSGGLKIQAEEVERALRPYLRVPYIITRAHEDRLGQQVVLMVEQGSVADAEAVCRRVLPKYWQPRRVLSVDVLPMTATGKPARARCEQLAADLLR